MFVAFLILSLQEPLGADLPTPTSLSALSPTEVLKMADGWNFGDDRAWRQLALNALGTDSKTDLFLGRLLARSGSTAGGGALTALLHGKTPLLRNAALATLALEAFVLDDEAQAAVANVLDSYSADDDPEFLARAAATLHGIGDSSHRRTALRRLRSMAASENRAAREAGALALARTGVTVSTDITEILEGVASDPGLRGLLASSLLERQEQKARYRAKLRALEDLFRGEGQTGGLEILQEVLSSVALRHMEGDRFTQEELLAAAADGLLRRLDPYSNFMTPDEVKEFMFDIHPEYGGIGAYVNTVDGFFTIVRPIYSGPAFEVGLRTGDQILSVEGWSTVEQPNDEIIRRLKGPPGTEVKVEVFRRGWPRPREMAIPRRKIGLPILQQEMLPGGVLYLDLVSFSGGCGDHIHAAIAEADAGGDLEGVILDLRNNPGGLLHEAVQVCDVFLNQGKTVVTTLSREEGEETHTTEIGALVDERIPLSILINRNSASASEIVSGALGIHGRATTIGERTHGKGSVQNLSRLKGVRDERWDDQNRNGIWDEWEPYVDRNENGAYDFGPRVKLTIAYYFLPDGSTIHTQRDHDGTVIQEGGVEPEIKVAMPTFPPATLRELDRLVGKDAFRNFASEILATNPELAVELAEYDGRDENRYPGFAPFFQGLETILDPADVRSWTRLRLRESVADERGRSFPGNGFLGDYQEDPQLAEAIRQILHKAGTDITMVVEYATVLSDPPQRPEKG